MQLKHDVRRIVIDEASQMTEAALVGTIGTFYPPIQIVLIGDSKQLSPFKYIKDDIISEMGARSALGVLQLKNNVPVIRLRETFRQSEPLMRPYSDVFYDGKLKSGKTTNSRLLLSPIFNVSKDCMFVNVEGSKSTQSGTSKINHGEMAALKFVVSKLKHAGYDHTSIMVIAYYEAQRRLAATRLPNDYEVLTVDSSQGREKDIIIVLTTRDMPTDEIFFTCDKRCNVSVSRHKEALIVLGKEGALLKTEPWNRLIKEEYFCTYTYTPA
ncbi:hypothetical protein PENTCL1PPCAC_7228 [Pristionchus entomophagus]|uniref:DNA2/NAM7 helicase-like C-terminal domain-containing protein n=1 Tax=Pristionchus entomophagus TaxID=358040 RepID=A0AAV5SPJ2_9BILA|nr:hypothetical protein PENTCL1PPCAC_7228 [Pristionchus entomophagus]